ncbi:MAG: choice-of-anchor B family protein [Planctomycetota bacterium]|nr:MAG: choice-of-anchor B family protein [Planctomycetota bacterium]
MLNSPLRRLAPVMLLGLALPALAHDDDPKVLSLQRPYQGPGFQSAAALVSGGGTTTLNGFSFPSTGVQLLSWLPLNMLGGGSSANDCWGYVAPSGREYAIIGTSNNTVFVEVTSPGNPQVVATMPGPTSLWRDTKVYQDHAYSVSEGGSGIQVFDMGQIDNGTVTLVGTVNDVGTSATHNVAIDEVSGFLYRSGGGSNGLRIYSLANPDNPTFVGQWNTKYVHDVQIVTYTTGPLAGTEVAYCCGGFNGGSSQTGLTILDVTNKSNIQIMDEVFYSNPAYSHQGWLSEDRNYFYLGDELDEDGVLPTTTHVIDVSDPTNAFSVGPFTNGNQAIGHNLFTKGNLIYEANYRSGLRVFDTSASQTAPVEVAMFDTYPDDDHDNYNGLWSCYPYLPSGIVLGSDREKGLFVWWVGDALVTFDFPSGIPVVVDPTGEAIPVQITEAFPGALLAGSEKFFYDAGAGFVAVPLTNLGGGSYEANVPALPCGTEFDWYVSAESSNGIFWASPDGAPASTYTSFAGGTVNYCTAVANSTGVPAVIASAGTLDVATNDFELRAWDLPSAQTGVFFYGADQVQQIFGNGILCVGGTFYRLDVVQADIWGFASYTVDFNNPPHPSGQVLPGSSWNFQFWYRDPAAGGAFFNLSEGLAVTFCP